MCPATISSMAITSRSRKPASRRSRLSQAQAAAYLEKVSAAFTPAAPITVRDLFAGRLDQLQAVLDVGSQRGQHAAVYGERGVGKTSLATIAASVFSNVLGAVALRVNCDGTDDYSTVWRKVLNEITFTQELPGRGFGAKPRVSKHTLAAQLPEGEVSPNDVRRLLVSVGQSKPVVVFVDEFDRLENEQARRLFADTIKTLSDQLVPATIVLVGVADNVDELIEEHRSVERALAQIHMPRMSPPELREIIDRGLKGIPMTIDSSAAGEITRLSQGLPHYTHLITQSAARAALITGSPNIDSQDVEQAIAVAIKKAQENIIKTYHVATSSSRETLYAEVLLACALAKTDDLGYFAAADVRKPLTMIMGKKYDIPAFARHLNALSDGSRGDVLQKAGMTRRFRYRFNNPLLAPFVIMRGLNGGNITVKQLQALSPA
jgi:Cdc6-like AAA superfamily ATPase